MVSELNYNVRLHYHLLGKLDRIPEERILCLKVLAIDRPVLYSLACTLVELPVSEEGLVDILRIKLVEMVRGIDLLLGEHPVPESCLSNHTVKTSVIVI